MGSRNYFFLPPPEEPEDDLPLDDFELESLSSLLRSDIPLAFAVLSPPELLLVELLPFREANPSPDLEALELLTPPDLLDFEELLELLFDEDLLDPTLSSLLLVDILLEFANPPEPLPLDDLFELFLFELDVSSFVRVDILFVPLLAKPLEALDGRPTPEYRLPSSDPGSAPT